MVNYKEIAQQISDILSEYDQLEIEQILFELGQIYCLECGKELELDGFCYCSSHFDE